jgi:hypothetical protein
MSMLLSAEMFQTIVDALRSDASRERDKRTAPRVGLRAQVTVLPAPGATSAPPERVRCRNLSASGIGLVHNKEMRKGIEFVVRFEATGLATPVHVSCVVVHCNKQGSDVYAIGARIIRVLSSDEAARLAAMAA